MEARGQCHSPLKLVGDTMQPKLHQHTKCGSYRRYAPDIIILEITSMPKWGMTLSQPQMQPYIKCGISTCTSNNIGDMLQTHIKFGIPTSNNIEVRLWTPLF